MTMLTKEEDSIDLLNDSNPFLFAKEDVAPKKAEPKPKPTGLFDEPKAAPPQPVQAAPPQPVQAKPAPAQQMPMPMMLPKIGAPPSKPKPALFDGPAEVSAAQQVQSSKPTMSKRPPKKKKTTGMFGEESKKDSGNPFFMNATKSTTPKAAPK